MKIIDKTIENEAFENKIHKINITSNVTDWGKRLAEEKLRFS